MTVVLWCRVCITLKLDANENDHVINQGMLECDPLSRLMCGSVGVHLHNAFTFLYLFVYFICVQKSALKKYFEESKVLCRRNMSASKRST